MPIPQAEGEKSYMMERWSLNGFQMASIAATPIYAISALRKGSFSIRSLVRYNWIIPTFGAAAGGASAFTVTSRETAAATAARTIEMRYNKNTVKQDDMQLVGSIVGALIVPALFLRRAGLINGVLGGAGLGSAGGILTHYFRDVGSVEDLKHKGEELISEGKKYTSGAKSDARQTGESITDEARAKGQELSNEARQKKGQLLDKLK